MKKEARYKLNAKSQKSGFLTTAKISRIFKTDFLTIYHTSASFFFHPKASEYRYTFIAFLVHFDSIPGTPLSILNEQVFLAKCSFDHKLRFPRSLLYRETLYQRTFIQIYKYVKAIYVAKHLHFLKKAFIMNKNHRLIHCVTVNSILRFINLNTIVEGGHNAYSSNTGYR